MCCLVMKNIGHLAADAAAANRDRPTLVVIVGITRAVEITLITGPREELYGHADRDLTPRLDMCSNTDTEEAVPLNKLSYPVIFLYPLRVTLQIFSNSGWEVGLLGQLLTERLDQYQKLDQQLANFRKQEPNRVPRAVGLAE